MTDTNRTEIVRLVDGEPMISATGMSLLLGVPVTEVEQLRAGYGTSYLPADWVQRGQRRAKEAKRWGRSDAMLDALAYWAQKDFGADLFEDAFGTVWAVSPEGRPL
ncbi:hypothetical protein [Mycolicibacterium elephantis]